jgi:hypothetical protein
MFVSSKEIQSLRGLVRLPSGRLIRPGDISAVRKVEADLLTSFVNGVTMSDPWGQFTARGYTDSADGSNTSFVLGSLAQTIASKVQVTGYVRKGEYTDSSFPSTGFALVFAGTTLGSQQAIRLRWNGSVAFAGSWITEASIKDAGGAWLLYSFVLDGQYAWNAGGLSINVFPALNADTIASGVGQAIFTRPVIRSVGGSSDLGLRIVIGGQVEYVDDLRDVQAVERIIQGITDGRVAG